ncbi:WxcM-like domain-containing protein [Nitrosopumilus sp.]|uniref:WxcM-like domain-containing protein n=1 Tax=Nitrosopumilus sp. TaxID=2024843 RepID=UPI003D0C7014
MTEFQIIDLENHVTKDVNDGHQNGNLSVIWRDWDKIIKNPPKMIYLTTVFPKEVKGPHLHSKRTSYLTCIEGKVIVIVQDFDGVYKEIECSSEKPQLICIPNNYASAHINVSKNISKILVLADIAWKPDDNEMRNVSFNDYDWKKWDLNSFS